MRLLVTGADGFVGRHLVGRLAKDGHRVAAACRPGGRTVEWAGDVAVMPLELTDDASVRQAVEFGADAVVPSLAHGGAASPQFQSSVNDAIVSFVVDLDVATFQDALVMAGEDEAM